MRVPHGCDDALAVRIKVAMMFDYIDTIPDLQFMAIFIAILIAEHVGCWAFNKWSGK